VRTAESFWSGKLALVTGGASFIGSTLTDQLVARGAQVRIVDDLSSGHLDNIRGHLGGGNVDFLHADLREPGVTRAAMHGVDTVFHLAADHGGRGYVDLHQAGPASNFFLDGLVFAEALRAKVKKVVFASSGCVYPNFLQSDTHKEIYLTEEMTNGPKDADNSYGWAKLMGEITLQAYAKEHGMGAASCRYFTVYGPRGVENHAVIAMIARAFMEQNPFEIWATARKFETGRISRTLSRARSWLAKRSTTARRSTWAPWSASRCSTARRWSAISPNTKRKSRSGRTCLPGR
jgi:nucleoside-diphosphate-sugar epimerase